jgi:hypothetical protein
MAFGFNIGNAFGGGPSAAQQLSNNGYTPYTVSGAPDEAGAFSGYQAQNANTTAAAPYTAAQQSLLSQLQSQANGTGGPSVAQQQLQSGLSQNLASEKAAAAGARGPNAGADNKNLQTNMANANAGVAGSAAALRANETENAQGQVANLANTGVGQQNQLAEANQAAANQAGQYNAGLQSELGAMTNQDWATTQGLNAQQAAQYNQMVGGITSNQEGQNNTLESQTMGSLVNFGAGALTPATPGGSGGTSSIMSDEDEKTDTDDASGPTQSFLDKVSGQFGGQLSDPTTDSAGDVPSATSGASGGPPSLGSAPSGGTGQPVQMPNTSNSGSGSNPWDDAYAFKVGNAMGPASGTDQLSSISLSNASSGASSMMGGAGGGGGGASSAMSGIGALAAMAEGGTTTKPTTAVVGEEGPEVVDLPEGATVSPNTSPKTQGFLQALKAHSYKYKDPNADGAAPGTHYGPMAQELEAAGPVGKSVVEQGPDGVKRVNTGRLSLALAGAGHVLSKRVDALETAMNAKAAKKAKLGKKG